MMMLVVLSCVVAACLGAETEHWHRSKFPNPFHDTEKDTCGRGMKSWVCDPNNILTEADANQLDVIIEKVYNDTRCPCSVYACKESNQGGYRIGVALVPNMLKDGDNVDQDDEAAVIDHNLHEANLFATDVLTRWSLGRCREGVIIFYSLNDNVLYTKADTVALETLTATHMGEISMNKRYLFNHRTLFEGLRQLIADYKRVFNGTYHTMGVGKAEPEDPQAVVGGAPLSITSVFMLLCAALSALILLC